MPKLNLTHELITLFNENTVYLGERGPGVHLIFQNMTNLAGQLQFIYYNENTQIVENIQSFDIYRNQGLDGAYTTPLDFKDSHDESFWTLPASCDHTALTSRITQKYKVFSHFPYNPEEFIQTSE